MTFPQQVQVSEPALMIRINRSYSPGMSTEALYESTRGVWVIGSRRDKVQYALAVSLGIVQEVYSVDSWHPAGSTAYETRAQQDVELDGRWEFSGRVAPDSIRSKYLEQSVAHYFPRGAANPITYVNIR